MRVSGLTFAIVSSVTSSRINGLFSRLSLDDDVIFVQPGETVFTEHRNPTWFSRALNPWAIVLHPYEMLGKDEVQILRHITENSGPARYTVQVEMPRCATDAHTLRMETRIFHREALGKPYGSLPNFFVSCPMLPREDARLANQQRLCTALDWIDQEPKNPASWLDAAGIYCSLRSWRHVETCARQALHYSMGTEAIDATQLLAQALYRLGRYRQVIEVCRTEHSLGNTSNMSLLHLAETHLSLGNFSQAHSVITQALEIHSDPDLTQPYDPTGTLFHVAHAQILTMGGQINEALEVLNHLPHEAMLEQNAAYTVALVLATMGHDKEALEGLQGLYDHIDIGVPALKLTAQIHERSDNWREACGRYEQVWKRGTRDQDLALRWYRAAERCNQAASVEAIIMSDLSSSSLMFPLEASEALGDLMDTSIQSPVLNSETYVRLGAVLVKTGRYGDALPMLQEGLKINPSNLFAMDALRFCQDALGINPG